MNLTDTHIHLHFPPYEADLPEVIQRAIQGGVNRFLNIGTDLEDSRKAVAVAEKYPEVYAAIGYHPHETKSADPADLAELEKLLRHPKVLAIGEVGLDYFHEHSPRDVQQKLLQTFLGWYREYQKPIIIHCRDAYEDMLRILRDFSNEPYRGVMHCYSSDKVNMRKFLDLGFYIAFGGALTYKKNDVLREACAACPKDRLLLETDGPYLAPQSVRGKRNEPFYMIETAEYAAKLHGMNLDQIADITTSNARTLFGIR